MKCFYVPVGAVFMPVQGGITQLTYAQVRQYGKPGDRFGFSCDYLDGDHERVIGTYTIGEDPPEPVGTRQQDALAALDLWVHGDFPSPTVSSKPGLENQRVGIATYFAVPTIAGAVTAGERGTLLLTATPQKRVTFKVPVVDHAPETFECGGDTSTGVPDSRCSHTFNYRTGQSVLAEVTVYFNVTYTSDVTGEVDVPVGPTIARTSLVPMIVKDLQARAN